MAANTAAAMVATPTTAAPIRRDVVQNPDSDCGSDGAVTLACGRGPLAWAALTFTFARLPLITKFIACVAISSEGSSCPAGVEARISATSLTNAFRT
jgi:hypothetical protein